MIIRKLEVNGKTVVLTEDVIRELHRQEHIEEGKLMIERFASKDVYNKMTDDDFDMVVDEFEYILNTTNDDTAEMMEEAGLDKDGKTVLYDVEQVYHLIVESVLV